MRVLLRLCGLVLLLACLPGWAQLSSKVIRIDIKHLGPQSVSDELIRSHIRVKVGDLYQPIAADDDVRGLYGTGLFYNIRVASDRTRDGIVLTYIVQGNPRLAEVKFSGNKKFSDSKLKRKVTSKVGEPFSERKLFTDTQEILKMYQKAGYPRTEVKYTFTLDEGAGRASATFEITESPKIKIVDVVFDSAQAFKQKQLRKVIKTRRHWMFSWLTGSGYLKEDQLDEDRDKLAEFYRDHGYIDFEIKDIKYDYPSPKKMIVHFVIYEGRQYKVGSITFSGNKVFTIAQLTNSLRFASNIRGKAKTGQNGLAMDVGDIFTPKGLTKDTEAVEDFYGAKGYIDVTASSRNLVVVRVPNTQTGTMDLNFKIDEGQKFYVEKVDIRGNIRTKDKVIRRELAVAPGEVFDMVRVRRSKQRLEGLQYFEKVDTRSEPTEMTDKKNLVVGVDEKPTGNFTIGAGFSSVDAIVGFAEVSQGNFDLFHPPTFTGGGQKFRLRVQIGTERQDYVMSFIEPWFLGRKLSLGVDLYYRNLGFESLDNIYDVVRAGGRVSLTRALWSDFVIGSVSYTLEDVGILLNPGYHDAFIAGYPGPGPFGDRGGPTGQPPGPTSRLVPANVPTAILEQVGYSLLPRVGGSIAYDTRNSVQLPNKGQRSEFMADFVGGPLGGEKEFYKLEAKTAWYFRGLATGHVLEVVARTGIAQSLQDQDVPFYDRYYLGGLYSLRGYKYRSISPRQAGFDEPIGGDTYWFGSAEYSIPVIEKLRVALFYDVGNVSARSFSYDLEQFDSNWGLGMRLNLPIGPLRLDYGIPIRHDQYNGSSGRFQFGVGYTREF
jgi:outer membrane protein insertion porin family